MIGVFNELSIQVNAIEQPRFNVGCLSFNSGGGEPMPIIECYFGNEKSI
jgi:hypothetical protein